MAESSIPVDLFNPGQVFACLGLMEAADVLCGNARAGFAWHGANVRFHLAAHGDEGPVPVVLDFLASARVRTLAPARSDGLSTEKWRVPTEVLEEGAPYPGPSPESPATMPAVLEGPAALAGVDRARLEITHWADGSGRDLVKFWAGAAGYPGGALVRDALELICGAWREHVGDPFSLAAPQSSSFRFDWRRDNIPVELGFNLNDQPRIEAVGYPLVELLAAIGLSYARPTKVGRNKLHYRYAVIGVPRGEGDRAMLFDPSLMRAALGGAADLPFPQRRFSVRLDWPGKENQARAITTVTEELNR